MPDQLSKMTKSARRNRRLDVGEESIPAVWRGRVDVIREEGDAAGVYVRAPRLVGDSHLGPLEWIGQRPQVGDRVLLGAVEGRMDELVILGVLGR